MKISLRAAMGLWAALCASGCDMDVAPLPQAQVAYNACADSHNDKRTGLSGQWAFVSGWNGQDSTCYWHWGEQFAAQSIEAARARCAKDYPNCFTFSTSKGLSDWAKAIADNGGHAAASMRVYELSEEDLAYRACTAEYNSRRGSFTKGWAFVSGVDGVASYCYWSWNYDTAAAAEQSALGTCKSRDPKCFVYATSEGVERWAKAVSDRLGGVASSGGGGAAAAAAAAANCDPKKEPAQRIEGCTAFIDKGEGGDERLALAFLIRGTGYLDKQDLHRGLADLNEAVRRNPDFWQALYQRGQLYRERADFGDAARDLGRAASLLDAELAAKPSEDLRSASADIHRALAALEGERKIETMWVDYLKDLQADGPGAFANWSGPPYDLYVSNHRLP